MILSDCDVQMQHNAGRIGPRVYWIIRTGANYECPSIGSDFIPQCPSNALKLKLGYNLNLLLEEMKAATGRDIAEQVIRPVKLIPASLDRVCHAPLLICIVSLCREQMKIIEWWMRKQAGKRLIVALMEVLIE